MDKPIKIIDLLYNDVNWLNIVAKDIVEEIGQIDFHSNTPNEHLEVINKSINPIIIKDIYYILSSIRYLYNFGFIIFDWNSNEMDARIPAYNYTTLNSVYSNHKLNLILDTNNDYRMCYYDYMTLFSFVDSYIDQSKEIINKVYDKYINSEEEEELNKEIHKDHMCPLEYAV